LLTTFQSVNTFTERRFYSGKPFDIHEFQDRN
jgi:hypothetical protein